MFLLDMAFKYFYFFREIKVIFNRKIGISSLYLNSMMPFKFAPKAVFQKRRLLTSNSTAGNHVTIQQQ